jgi:hypothetical protein
MNGYWQTQKQIASNNLAIDAGDAGARYLDNKAQQKRQADFDIKTRAAYKLALDAAKQTGRMPAEHQVHVPIDYVAEQSGIKVVALRELGKNEPEHPLVVSEKCREFIADATLINYNMAERPRDVNLEEFAPDEELAQRIFEAQPK